VKDVVRRGADEGQIAVRQYRPPATMPARPRAAHNCQHARNFQHPHALRAGAADKDVAGKQREIQGDPRSVAPLALRAVEGQIVLNLPHAQVQIYALFMARSRVDCEPFRRGLRIRQESRGVAAHLKDVLMRIFKQSFAILNWVGFFHTAPTGTSELPPDRSCESRMWGGVFMLRSRPTRIRVEAVTTIAWAHGGHITSSSKCIITFVIMPLQQKLWVDSGSGSRPSV